MKDTPKKDHWHWKTYQLKDICKAKSVYELGTIGVEALQKMPEPATLVCGQIASGSYGQEINIMRLQRVIVHFSQKSKNVFDQLAFEQRLDIIEKSSRTSDTSDCCAQVISDIYLRLIQTGKISKVILTPTWKNSRCAKAIVECARTQGIKLRFLTSKKYRRILKK